MWDGFNKRKFPRLNVQCEIIIESNINVEPLQATTENLGIGGLCVVLSRDLKRFEACIVRLSLKKNQEKLQCQGKVVWVIPTAENPSREKQFDIGIEFLNLDAAATKEIQDYLAASHSRS